MVFANIVRLVFFLLSMVMVVFVETAAAKTGVQINPRLFPRRKMAAAEPGVIFGGYLNSGTKRNDFYVLGTDNMWKVWSVTDGDIPPLQSGSLTRVKGRYFLFGGQRQDDTLSDDLWFTADSYTDDDLLTPGRLPPLRWTKARKRDAWPLPRRRHAAVATLDGELQIMFGLTEDSALDDVWRYNLDNGEWRQLQPSGGLKAGMRRMNPCCATDDTGRTLCFGGTDPQRGDYNDILVLDELGLTWRRVVAEDDDPNAPSVRRLAICVYHDNTFTVTLGWDASVSQAIADRSLHVFDTKEEKWVKKTNPEDLALRAVAPRRDNTCLFKRGTKAYVFGGHDGDDPSRYLNDMWVFDIGSTTATLIQTNRLIPDFHGEEKTPNELFFSVPDSQISGRSHIYLVTAKKKIWMYTAVSSSTDPKGGTEMLWIKPKPSDAVENGLAEAAAGQKLLATFVYDQRCTVITSERSTVCMTHDGIEVRESQVGGAIIAKMPVSGQLFVSNRSHCFLLEASTEKPGGWPVVQSHACDMQGEAVAVEPGLILLYGTGGPRGSPVAQLCRIQSNASVACDRHEFHIKGERRYTRYGGALAYDSRESRAVYCGGFIAGSQPAAPGNDYCFALRIGWTGIGENRRATVTWDSFGGTEWQMTSGFLAFSDGSLYQLSSRERAISGTTGVHYASNGVLRIGIVNALLKWV